MTCHDWKDMMMSYLDNELDEEQKKRFEEHLKGCPECTKELKEFRNLKAITDEVTLVEPEDKLWADYWSGVYNRIERGTGLIIFSIAAIILIIFCGFKMIENIIENPNVECIFKLGLVLFIIGLAILLVSVLRERLYFHKKDRYKDVRR
jgi:hypothetical protein